MLKEDAGMREVILKGKDRSAEVWMRHHMRHTLDRFDEVEEAGFLRSF